MLHVMSCHVNSRVVSCDCVLWSCYTSCRVMSILVSCHVTVSCGHVTRHVVSCQFSCRVMWSCCVLVLIVYSAAVLWHICANIEEYIAVFACICTGVCSHAIVKTTAHQCVSVLD